jgi:endonuclease/exonuclease/phosphatase family metal-dependent hydrolase
VPSGRAHEPRHAGEGRRARRGTWAIVVGLLAARVIAPSAPLAAAAPADGTITVMTRNLYLGASLEPARSARSLPGLLAAVGRIHQAVQATDFPRRADALADEITAAQPDLVALQEVAIWRTDRPPDGPVTPAREVAYDFLALLLERLADRGVRYTPVASVTNADPEAPSAFGVDVRYTDRDVILARGDAGLRFSDQRGQRFQARLRIGSRLLGPLEVRRGWASVRVHMGGARSLLFVTTHLDPTSAAVRMAQARELVRETAAARLPVVIGGDMNARASMRRSAVYRRLLAAGLADAWRAAGSPRGGRTCCHSPGLRNPQPTLTKRIDLVLVRGVRVLSARTVGDRAADRTPSGLWPSDHAGVVVRLRPAPVASLSGLPRRGPRPVP